MNGLKRNLANVKEKMAAVDIEIQQYTSNIQSLQTEKARDKSVLDNYASNIGPALTSLEEQLKFHVEGLKRQ